MKKIFGGIELTWKKVIISALVIGPVIGLLNSVIFLRNSSFNDPSIYFSFWILIGILIIMNSKSNKDAALKAFVFFLISQPLIYLVEVPFDDLHWQLFRYYKPWAIWTLFCLPMGYIGYYLKKNKWWGLLILSPMIVLSSSELQAYISGLIFSFPRHLLSVILTSAAMIIYPLYIYKNKKIRMIGLIISIIGIIVPFILVFSDKPVYETEIMCSGGTRNVEIDKNTKVTLQDSKYGDLSIEWVESIDTYCIHAKFTKQGETDFTVEQSNGTIRKFHINIKENTYKITEIGAVEE